MLIFSIYQSYSDPIPSIAEICAGKAFRFPIKSDDFGENNFKSLIVVQASV